MSWNGNTFDISYFDDESIVVGQTKTWFLMALSGTLALALLSLIISKILNKRKKQQELSHDNSAIPSSPNKKNTNNARVGDVNLNGAKNIISTEKNHQDNTDEKNNCGEALESVIASLLDGKSPREEQENVRVNNARSNRFSLTSSLLIDDSFQERGLESDDEFLMRGVRSSSKHRVNTNLDDSTSIVAHSDDGASSITDLFIQKKVIDEKVCDIHEEFESKLIATVERDKKIKEILLETLGEQEVCVQQLNELMENVRVGYSTSLWEIIEELARNVVRLRNKFDKLKKDYGDLVKGLYDYFTQQMVIILQASRENQLKFEEVSWKLKEKVLELERSLVYLEEKDKEISKLKDLLEKRQQDSSKVDKDRIEELLAKESKIKELSQDIEKLNSALNEKNKENKRIIVDLEEANTNAQEWHFKFTQTLQENNSLKHSLENTSKQVSTSVDMSRNVEYHLTTIKQELETSKSQHSKLDHANQKLQLILEESERKIAEITNKNSELQELNNSLKNKISISLNSDMERLERELRTVEAEKEQIQEEKEKAEANLTKFKQQLQDYDLEIREKTKKVNELEIELAKAMRSVTIDKKEIDHLAEQIELLKKQIKDLSFKISQSDLAKMEAENLLNSANIALGNEKRENESLRSTIIKWEDKILEMRSKLDKHKENSVHLNDEIFKKDKLIKQLSQQLEEHEKQKELLSEKLNKEIADLDKQNKDISDLNASKTSIHQSLSEKLASCEEQSTSMKDQLESLKSKVEELKNTVKVKKGKIVNLKEHIENLDEEKRTLESKHTDDILKLNGTISMNEQLIQSLEHKVTQSGRQYETMIAELTLQLEKDKTTFQNERAELNLKLKSKDEEISNQFTKVSNLEKDLLISKEAQQIQESRSTELKRLKEQADISKQNIQEELEKQKEQNTLAERHYAQLKKEFEYEKDLCNKLTENVNVLRIQIQNLEMNLEEKDKSISLSNQNCQNLEQDLIKLKGALQEKTNNLDTQTKLMEDVYKKLKVLIPEDMKLQESEMGYMVLEIIEAVRKRENKLSAEAERLNSTVQQLKSQLESKDSQVLTSKEKRRKLKATIQDLTQDHKQEVEKLKIKLQETNQQLTTLESSNSEKSNTIKQLQDELNNLKTSESNLSTKMHSLNSLVNQQKTSLEQSEHSLQAKETIISSLKNTIVNLNQNLLELESKSSKIDMEKSLLEHNLQILKSSNSHLTEDAKSNITMFQELQQKHRIAEKELFQSKLDLESERESKLVLEQKLSMLFIYKKQVEQAQEELARQQQDSADIKKKLEHNIVEKEKRIKVLEDDISRFSDLNNTKDTVHTEELKKKTNEIQHLSAKVLSSEKNLTDLKEESLYEKKKLQDKLDNLMKGNSDLKESESKLLARIEEQRRETKKKLEDLENDYQLQIENYISQLKNFEHTDSQHENKSLKDKVKELTNEIEELTQKLAEKVCENCMSLKKQLEDLELLRKQELYELKQEIATLEKDKTSIENDLLNTIKQLKKQVSSVEQSNGELSVELEVLKNKLNDKQQHILELENDNDKLTNINRKNLKELESEKMLKEQQLQDSLENYKLLSKKLQDKELELDTCKHNIEVSEKMILKLQQDTKKLNNEKFEQEASLTESKNEISRLEHLLKKTQQEYDQQLNDANNKHNGHNQRVAELENETSKLKAELQKSAEQYNNALLEHKQKLSSKNAEIENLEQEISKSSKDIKNSTQEVEHLSADLDRKNKRLEELEEEKETIRKEKAKIISKLEDDLSTKESDLKKVLHQIEDMGLQMENLQKRHKEELKAEILKVQESEHKLIDIQNNLESGKRTHKDTQDQLNISKEREQTLTESNTAMKQENEKLHKELSSLQHTVSDQKDKEEKKDKEVEDLHHQLANLKSNEKRLELEIDNLNKTIQHINAQKDAMSEEILSLSKNVSNLKSEKKTLQDELESKIDVAEKSIHKLEKEKRILEEKILELQDQNKQNLSQIDDFKEKEKTINANLQTSNFKVIKLEEENQHLKNQLSLQNGKLSDCESNCKTLETDLKEKVEKLLKENEHLHQVLDEEQNKLKNLNSEKKQTQTSLEADIEQFEKANKKLTKELDELKEKEEKLQKSLKEATDQARELSENVALSTNNCQDLQTAIQEKENAIKEASEQIKKLSEMSNKQDEKISSLEQEKSTLEQHVDAANTSLNALLGELEEVKGKQKDQKTSYEQLAKESNEAQQKLESSIQQLKHTNEIKQSEIDTLIKGNETLVEQMKNQRNSYEEQLGTLEEEKKQVVDKKQHQEEKSQKLETSLKDLIQKCNEKELLIEQANSVLESERLKNQDLSKQLNIKNLEIEGLEKQADNKDELTKEFRELKQREDKLKQDVEALQGTIQNLQKENQELSNENQSLTNEKTKLKQKISNLTNLIQKVHSELRKVKEEYLELKKLFPLDCSLEPIGTFVSSLQSNMESVIQDKLNEMGTSVDKLQKTYDTKMETHTKRIEELTKKVALLKTGKQQPVAVAVIEQPKTPKKELPPKEHDPAWKFMKLMEEAGFEFSEETYEKMRGKSIFSLLRTGKKLQSENKEDFYSNELEYAEKALSKWLERLAGQEYDRSMSLFKNLLDGVILCKYSNTLFPEIEPCKKFVEGTTTTQAAIGNVSLYTNFCKIVGISGVFEHDYLLKASNEQESKTTKERSSIVSNLALLFEFSVKCAAQPEMRTATLKKLQSSTLPLESPSRALLSSRTRSVGSMSFSKAQLSSIVPSTPESSDGSITDRQANIEGMMSSRTHYYQKATSSHKMLEEDEEKYFKETILQITERKDDGQSLLKIIDDGTALCMIVEKYYGKVIKFKNQPNKFQKNDNHQAFISSVHKIVKNTQRFAYTHDEIEKGQTKPLYALLKLFFEELEKSGKLKFSADDNVIPNTSNKDELNLFKEKIAMIDKSEGYSSPSTPTSVERMYQQPSPINNFKLSDSKLRSAIVNPSMMTPTIDQKPADIPSTINTKDIAIPTITKEIFFSALSRRGNNNDDPPLSARLLSPTPRSSRFHIDANNFTNKVADTIFNSTTTGSPRRQRRSFISTGPRSPTTPKVSSPPNSTFATPRLTADAELFSPNDIFEDLIDDLGVITTDESFEMVGYFKQAGSYITEDEQKEDFLNALKKTPASLNFTGCEEFVDSMEYSLIIQNLRSNKKIKCLTLSGSAQSIGVNVLIDWLKNKNNTPSLKKLVLIGWKEIDSLHKVCSERGISLVLE